MRERRKKYTRIGVTLEVVRLGGSLLLPDVEIEASLETLRARLAIWLRDRPGLRLWVCGTGDWGQKLFRTQDALRLTDEECHWTALKLMTVAGEMASCLVKGGVIARGTEEVEEVIDEVRRAYPGRIPPWTDCFIDSAAFVRDIEPKLYGPRLPADWTVTSDSVAARLAQAVDADALTLLKSCPGPETDDVFRWRETKVVDGFFPKVVATPNLRWVDLSTEPPVERRYRS